MRILITGSRDWPDDGSVERAIKEAVTNPVPHLTATIVHGDCPSGADAFAKRYGESQAPWFDVEGHPAGPFVWKNGKRGFFLRNKHMVDLGADICLAFVMPCRKPEHRSQGPHDSHGTKMTIDLAMDQGITVKVYRP